MAHVVHWGGAHPAQPCGALAAMRFGHAFFATLRNPSATVPEVRLWCTLGGFLWHACHVIALGFGRYHPQDPNACRGVRGRLCGYGR